MPGFKNFKPKTNLKQNRYPAGGRSSKGHPFLLNKVMAKMHFNHPHLKLKCLHYEMKCLPSFHPKVLNVPLIRTFRVWASHKCAKILFFPLQKWPVREKTCATFHTRSNMQTRTIHVIRCVKPSSHHGSLEGTSERVGNFAEGLAS